MILCFVSGAPLAESSSGFTLLGMKEKNRADGGFDGLLA